MANDSELVSIDANNIKRRIFTIRGKQVMLDSDLAELYRVQTKIFNQSVNRNIERFPEHFRFRLTKEEFASLRSQIVTSKGRGGRRYMPFVFTEQGIAMLSAVLKSDILDGKTVYHIGASLKDAGKKCFGVTLMKDAGPDLMKKHYIYNSNFAPSKQAINLVNTVLRS